MTQLIALVALVFLASGCVLAGPRTPNLVADTSEPPVEPAPNIKVVIGHEYQVEGVAQVEGDPRSETDLKESLHRVMKETPLLRNASLSSDGDVHYLLVFDTRVNDHPPTFSALGPLTLFLVPVLSSSDVAVTASLYEAATATEIGVHQAQGSLDRAVWLPFLPFLPVMLALDPTDWVYDDTYRDVLILVARDLQGKQLPRSVPASKLNIEIVPKEPERPKRKVIVQ